jgi:Gti1/Pac2 family transcription factor
MITSGNIFVYEENASGIRRWTDGIHWSPSRNMGNFFAYREIQDDCQPVKKTRVMKKVEHGKFDLSARSEEDKQLIGAFCLEVYSYKPGGLMKKTLSVEFQGVRHHIISYYRVEDIKNGLYHRPTEDEFFRNFEPRRELIENQNFKFPIEDNDKNVDLEVSLKSHLKVSHQHTANTGFPVMANIPQHSLQLNTSSHRIPAHATALLPYKHRASTGGCQIPAGQLDLFSLDAVNIVQCNHVHHFTTHSTPIIGEYFPATCKPLLLGLHQIQSSSVPAGETERNQQRTDGSQMAYWDSSPHVPQSVQSFSSISSYSSKYVDDVSYRGRFIASVQKVQSPPTAELSWDSFPAHKCLDESERKTDSCEIIGLESQNWHYCRL